MTLSPNFQASFCHFNVSLSVSISKLTLQLPVVTQQTVQSTNNHDFLFFFKLLFSSFITGTICDESVRLACCSRRWLCRGISSLRSHIWLKIRWWFRPSQYSAPWNTFFRRETQCRFCPTYVTRSHERGAKSILSFLRYWHSKEVHRMQFTLIVESSPYLKR